MFIRGYLLQCVSPLVLATLAGCMLLGQAGPVAASESFRKELGGLAKSIKDVLEEEKQTAVAMCDFSGPAQLDANSGPGIQQLLTQELLALKVSVKKDANLSIKGRYARVPNKTDPDLVNLKLTVEVLDSNDERKAEFHALITGNTDIAKAFGPTVYLPPLANYADRNQEIRKRLDKPYANVAGSKVSASPDSPYAVELLVKGNSEDQARPREVHRDKGQAYVDIQRYEIYEVKVYNNSPYEAAVSLTIDGLDSFTFSEDRDEKTGQPKYSNYIVSPYKWTIIKGWHRTSDPKRDDNVLSFLVTEYGKGAASQQPSRGKIGVLSVTFAAAWSSAQEMPPDERGSRNAGNETGFGPPQKVGFAAVKRSIGVPRSIVSIRYTR